MDGRRSATAVLVAFGLVLAAAFPTLAGAHARLLRTTPPQGSEVASAPARATFSFDEAVRSTQDAELTRHGVRTTVQAPAELAGGGRELVVALPPKLARGVYDIRWHVTSDDGHREVGTLTFGVGVKPVGVPASAAEQTQQDGLLTFARWLFVLGVLAAGGLAGVRLALGRVLAEWGSPTEPGTTARTLAAVLVLTALGAAVELASLPGALSTRFGVVTAIAGALALLGALAAAASLGRRTGRVLSTAIALALLAAPALAGHALSPGRIRVLSVPVDLLHTAAAAAWLGAVLWLGALAAAAARGDRGAVPLVHAARRITPIAPTAIGLVGVTGAARALLELERVSQLWDTGYGRLLLVKTGLLIAIVAVGGLIGSRLIGRLTGRDDAPIAGRLRRTLLVETALIVAITVAVALLGSTTPPSALAGAAPTPTGPTVVFGRQARDRAVGIEVTPTGDRLAVAVSVLAPSGSPDNGVGVGVYATAPRPGPADARRCGPGRYCATIDRTSRVVVRIDPPAGAPSLLRADLPADPQTARAAAIVRTDARRVRALRTLVIHERLEGAPGEVLNTIFKVQAPDRLSYSGRGAGEAIVIGGRRWDRESPGRRWRRSAQDPLRVPSLDWSVVRHPSLLRSATYAGRPVWWVSFADPTIPAWFEVAIDRQTGLQLLVRMTAASHFMERRYGRFDDPVTIVPPETIP